MSITKEMGKPLAEARGEVAKAVGESRVCIGRASAPIGTFFRRKSRALSPILPITLEGAGLQSNDLGSDVLIIG
jgi:acyl-CoA reductase-like NAD-dependent aldehyde dehydrogenase